MNKAAKQQKLQSQKEPSKANGLQITKTRSKSPFVFGTKPRYKTKVQNQGVKALTVVYGYGKLACQNP